MTHEIVIGLEWLIATLEADATLAAEVPGGWHRGSAPTGTTLPFGIIGFQGGTDVINASGGVRLLNRSLFQAKVVGNANDTANVAAAASELDALLQSERLGGNATGGAVLSCIREQPLQYDENMPTGEKRTHIGGLYRFLIQQS